MATSKTTPDTPTVEEAAVIRTKKVIVQRPSNNRDMGMYLSLNGQGGVYPFDTPVEMPADMVDYFREQKVAQFHAGEDGAPVTTYINQFHIIDAR